MWRPLERIDEIEEQKSTIKHNQIDKNEDKEREVQFKLPKFSEASNFGSSID